LAAGAEQAARDRIAYGTGLFGEAAKLGTTALSPFQTQFGLSQLLEEAGQQPLDIGAQLGGRSALAGSQAGRSLLEGGMAAAQTRLGGQLASIADKSRVSQNLMKDFFGSLGFGQKQSPAPQSTATFGPGAYNPEVSGYYDFGPTPESVVDYSGGYSPY
jgi:hypothetical protein